MRKPILVISGFLGTGKTTLVDHLMKYTNYQHIGYLIHDYANINVDYDELSRKPIHKNKLHAITGKVKADVNNQIKEGILKYVNDDETHYIVIENSGLSAATDFAKTIDQGLIHDQPLKKFVYIDLVVTVVDASQFYQMYFLKDENASMDLYQLMMKQIEFANLIIINKTDLVSYAQLQEIKDVLEVLNHAAKKVETTFSNIDMNILLNQKQYDENQLIYDEDDTEKLSQPFVTKGDVSSFVFKSRAPFHPNRFDQFLNAYPRTIIRMKGVCWFYNQPKVVFKLSQSGKSLDIIPSAYWIGSMTHAEIKALFKVRPHLNDIWHPKYHDRLIELIFIGKNMDKIQILEDLEACVVGEDEVVDIKFDPFEQHTIV